MGADGEHTCTAGDRTHPQNPAIGGPFKIKTVIFSKTHTGWLATQWDSDQSPRIFPANREFYRENGELGAPSGDV